MCRIDDKLMIKPLLSWLPRRVISERNFSAAVFVTASPMQKSELKDCLSSLDLTGSYVNKFLHWLFARLPIQHKENVRCLRIWSQMSSLVSKLFQANKEILRKEGIYLFIHSFPGILWNATLSSLANYSFRQKTWQILYLWKAVSQLSERTLVLRYGQQ